ncbi:MAG: type I methionyl aminopeptidase [Minisyncoccales bacterium]
MIKIKSPDEIKIMAEGGKILAKIIKKLSDQIKPGITTQQLNDLAEELILQSGGQCSFKGYQNYPACLCVSINEEIVHSLPGPRPIKEGDLVSLDLGIFYRGYHTDMAITRPVGRVSQRALKLIRVTKTALKRGIKEIKPGAYLGDVGQAIQNYVESQGFNVVRELCGHGIGCKLHEDPQVLNYGARGTGQQLKEGMVLCLEPMVTMADWRIKKSEDGYGFKTIDNSLSCHFEQTVAVTKKGCQILTPFNF